MPHTVNLKNAKEVTKKLEHENHKMEERLKELKTAMEMEKDERGKQGGRFWQKGQTGTLSNYAFEVLSERRTNQNHAMKKRNFQLLKDEPLDLPTHSSVSGVVKHVAQQKKKMGKDSKARDTRCGQCEDCLASLTCVQCSENYCAGCFATFHLKGALKNHRSVPLHAAGARQSMTPQPTSLENTRISEVSSGEATSEDIIEQSYQPAPTNASSFVRLKQGTTSSSLLHGAYNEEDSAAVFQEALMKWRRAENFRSNDISQSNNLLMHPASTPPVPTVESSTSTIENGGSIPEVKSPSHSLSYAQRLLLKQHRRTALGSPYTSYLSYKSSNTSEESSSGNKNSETENDQLHQSEERVNFQSLLEAVNINFQPPTIASFTTKTSHTITDLTKFHEDQHPVDEFPPDMFEEATNLQTFRTEVKNRTKTNQEPGLHSKDLRSFRKDTAHVLEQLSPEAHRETELQFSQKVPSEETSFTGIKKKNEQKFGDRNSFSPIGQLESNKTPKLKCGHRKRVLPPTGAIATNTMKGILTKSPSCELKEVAQRVQATSLKSQSSMEGFFLVFVKPNPADSAHNIRPAITVQPKTVKISNKLYSLSPRSWHPDNSRGGISIVEDEHPPFPKDNAKTTLLHYTYSGQLEGNLLTLNQDDGSSDKILLPTEAQMVSIARGSGLSCTNDHSFSPSSKPIQKVAKGCSLTTVPRRLILTQRSVSCISASSKSHPKQHRPNSSTGVMESPQKRADDSSADRSTNQVYQLGLLHQRNKTTGWTAGCDLEHQREQTRDLEPWNQMSSETTPDTDSVFCKTEVQAFVGETEITRTSPSSRTTCQVTPQSSRPQGRVHKKTGRMSRAVVMDGDDLTRYDDDSVHDKFTQNVADKETLHCLEWELASENGWITAEGRISRLNLDDLEDSDDTSSSVQVNCCQDYGVSTSVLEDQVLDMDEEHELTSINMEEEEVRAL